MISRDTKIGKMLKEYPQTLEVLLSISEHFHKLNNPFLRKTLAPRVSVEQAAKIAGVNLSELLQKLNQKIGVTMLHENTSSLPNGGAQQSGAETVANSPSQERPVILARLKPHELDVRPILAGGTDPLKTILQHTEQLAPDEYLHLINSFEPVPLYSVLGKRGFDHHTEFVDGTFHVRFYRRMPASEKMPPTPGVPAEVPGREKVIELDVRQLAPPEPMMKILEALPQVDEQTLLFVHHHREPLFLYEKLQARGYQWHLQKIAENYFQLKIWKP